MSKNNAKLVQQKMADQKQKFGIRKLSVGIASVLVGTTFMIGVAHADSSTIENQFATDNLAIDKSLITSNCQQDSLDKNVSATEDNFPVTSESADSINAASLASNLSVQDVTNTDPKAQETRTVTADFVKINENGTPEDTPFDSATLDVYYIRQATKDLVTGKVTYDDWKLNTSKGANGFQVASGSWTLPTDSSADITVNAPEAPAGYVKVDTQTDGQLTTNFGIAANISSKLTTYYVPKSLTKKTVNRVINITLPNSPGTPSITQTITQPATITRPVKVNADDSGVVFDGFIGSGWTTGEWPRYHALPLPSHYTRIIKQIVTNPDGATTETTLNIRWPRPLPAQTVNGDTLPTVINVTFTATATATLSGTNQSIYTGNPITVNDLNNENGDDPISTFIIGPISSIYNLQAGDVEFSSDDGKTWSTKMPTNAGTYKLRWTDQGRQNVIKTCDNNSIKWEENGKSTITGTATYIITPAPTTSTLSNQTTGNYTKVYDAQPTTSIDPSKFKFTTYFDNREVVLNTTGLTSDSYEWVDANGNPISNPENVGTYYIKLKDSALATLQKDNPNFTLTNTGFAVYTITSAYVTGKISYVDLNGHEISQTPLRGNAGDKISVKVPAGYFIDGSNEFTIPKNGIVIVHVVKKVVATDNPTTSDKDVLNLINYTDENGKVIKTDKVTGKVGDKITVNVPDGYHFVDGKVPTVVIINNPEQTVKIVKDQHETGNPTTSDKDALNLINYTDENGKVIKTDKVTGKVGDKIIVNVPDGYHFVDGKVPTVVITNNPEQTVKIVKDQHETGEPTTSDKDILNLINYTDENGKVIKTDKVTGKIGDKITVNVPDGYHFVDGKVPTVVITGNPEQIVKVVKDQHEIGEPTTSDKDVLNLINYTDENGKVIKIDKVTGKIGDKIAVNVPDGYHFVDGKVPTVVITNNPEQTVKIVKDQHETGEPTTSDKDALNLINYTDENGKVIKTDKVTGKIGDTVKVDIPDGYHFIDGKVPTVVITDNPEQTVKIVKDQHETGEPTTSDKDVLNLINYTDENGKVIKTDKVTGKVGDKIIVNVPDGYHFVDGKVPTVVITNNPEQTVKIVKDQHETGEPTTSDKDILNLINYTDEDGKVIKTDKVTGKIGDKITVNVPDDYHFVDGKVPTVVITDNPEQTVKIVKNQHETGEPTTSDKDVLNLINYTDENGKVIKIDKVTGKIGDKITVNVPDGYHFIDGKTPVVTITGNPEQTVKIVKDQHETGEPTTSDKDVLNLINYTDENGKVIKTDKVIGKIGDKIIVNVPDGYHFVDGKVPTVVITNNPEQTVKIVKDQHETGDPTTSDKDTLNLINYTDENGKVIKIDKVTGKIGDKITVNVPDGYHFIDGKTPVVTITGNPEQTVKIVKDQHETGEPTTSDKDVLNLINYTDENGKVIKTDKVIGKIGDKIIVNVPDGYHFVDGKVPTVVITNNPEQTVKIVKDQHETGDPTTSDKDTLNLINYTDENGKVIKIDKVTGKIGDKITVNVPDGYHFADGKVPTVVITGNPEQTVKIAKDQHETGEPMTSDKDTLNLINYTDENGKVIKTDKVTGKVDDKITVNVPDGYHFVDGKVPTVVITETPEQTVKIAKNQYETGEPTTSNKDILNLINYTDENGKVIKTDKVTGKIGDEITVNIPDGYHFVDGEVPTVVITGNPEQTVKIAKDQHETGEPTTSDKDVLNLINYTDENGKVIKTDKVTGKIGDKITVNVPDSYHFVDGEVPTVTITENSEHVVKIVKDQVSFVDQPTIQTVKSATISVEYSKNGFAKNLSSTPAKQNAIVTNNAATKTYRLPQTGDQRETGLVALGLVSGLLGLIGLRKKKQN